MITCIQVSYNRYFNDTGRVRTRGILAKPIDMWNSTRTK